MKRLILIFSLFFSEISAQSFGEKYYKQILGTTVVVSVFLIGYLLKVRKTLKKENFDLKRNEWVRKNKPAS